MLFVSMLIRSAARKIKFSFLKGCLNALGGIFRIIVNPG